MIKRHLSQVESVWEFTANPYWSYFCNRRIYIVKFILDLKNNFLALPRIWLVSKMSPISKTGPHFPLVFSVRPRYFVLGSQINVHIFAKWFISIVCYFHWFSFRLSFSFFNLYDNRSQQAQLTKATMHLLLMTGQVKLCYSRFGISGCSMWKHKISPYRGYSKTKFES